MGAGHSCGQPLQAAASSTQLGVAAAYRTIGCALALAGVPGCLAGRPFSAGRLLGCRGASTGGHWRRRPLPHPMFAGRLPRRVALARPCCCVQRPSSRQRREQLLILVVFHVGAGCCYLLNLRRVLAGRLAVHAAGPAAAAAAPTLLLAAAALCRTG